VSTITTNTFILESNSLNVPGTVNYFNNTATFTPLSRLDFNKTYTATITTGVKDSSGMAMSEAHTLKFATCNENGSCVIRDCQNVTRKNIILFIVFSIYK